MYLQLEAFGDQQLSRDLLRFIHRSDDLSAAFDAILRDFYELQKQQFASEGRRGSGGWAPLTPGYAVWKERYFPGRKTLEQTGAMKQALTQPNAPGASKRVTRDSMEIVVALAYARHHQTGTRSMPRRRPVELTAADKTRWTKILQRHLTTGDPGMGIGL